MRHIGNGLAEIDFLTCDKAEHALLSMLRHVPEAEEGEEGKTLGFGIDVH